MKIITSEVKPPIPTRDFDYCAFEEGNEESQQYGWGATPEEAIADLKDKILQGYYGAPDLQPAEEN